MAAEGQTTWQRFGYGLAVIVIGGVLTLSCFLVLPLLKAITQPEQSEWNFSKATTAELPKPKPPEPKQEEEKPDEKPPPPQLNQQMPRLDLNDIDPLLSGGFGSGGIGAFSEFSGDMLGASLTGVDQLFDMSDLEEKPRPQWQPDPDIPPALISRMPCSVLVMLTVDAQGRVIDPEVVRSDDPMFNEVALKSIRQWTFEPGKRGGKPAVFRRVRQPITFQ